MEGFVQYTLPCLACICLRRRCIAAGLFQGSLRASVLFSQHGGGCNKQKQAHLRGVPWCMSRIGSPRSSLSNAFAVRLLDPSCRSAEGHQNIPTSMCSLLGPTSWATLSGRTTLRDQQLWELHHQASGLHDRSANHWKHCRVPMAEDRRAAHISCLIESDYCFDGGAQVQPLPLYSFPPPLSHPLGDPRRTTGRPIPNSVRRTGLQSTPKRRRWTPT